MSLYIRIKPTSVGEWMCSSAHSEPQNWNQQDWVWISRASYGFCSWHQRAARCSLLLCCFQYMPIECSGIHLMVTDWKFVPHCVYVFIIKNVFFISPVPRSFMMQLNSQRNRIRWWSGLNVFYDFKNGLLCMEYGSCDAESECGIRNSMEALS